MKVLNRLSGGIRNLLNINRFSNRDIVTPENVGVHTIDMQLIALAIYSDLGSDSFDIKDVIYRTLCHDLDEAVMCDIPRDVKYHDGDIYNKLKKISEEKLKGLNLPDDVLNMVFHSKDHDTFEGRLVSFLDVFQCYLKLLDEYSHMPRRSIYKILEDCHGLVVERSDLSPYPHVASEGYFLLLGEECTKVFLAIKKSLGSNFLFP